MLHETNAVIQWFRIKVNFYFALCQILSEQELVLGGSSVLKRGQNCPQAQLHPRATAIGPFAVPNSSSSSSKAERVPAAQGESRALTCSPPSGLQTEAVQGWLAAAALKEAAPGSCCFQEQTLRKKWSLHWAEPCCMPGTRISFFTHWQLLALQGPPRSISFSWD